MKKLLLLCGVVAVAMVWAGLSLGTEAQGAIITFSDGTLNNADWQQQVFMYFDGGTVTAGQVMEVGNSYRSILNVIHPGPNPNGLIDFHSRAGAVYDPQLLGAISSLDFSIDVIKLGSSFQTPPAQFGFGAALSQDGNVYALFQATASTTWETRSLPGLTAEDFLLVSNLGVDPNSHPDFSAAGGVIQLGFGSFNNNGAGQATETFVSAGIDNWDIDIHAADVAATPEPASLGIWAGLGIVGIVASRRRRQTRAA